MVGAELGGNVGNQVYGPLCTLFQEPLGAILKQPILVPTQHQGWRAVALQLPFARQAA